MWNGLGIGPDSGFPPSGAMLKQRQTLATPKLHPVPMFPWGRVACHAMPTDCPPSAMGKSRSAAVVVAYLLYHSHRLSPDRSPHDATAEATPIPPRPLDVSSALALLRRGRPLAEPNKGFMEQLELFHAMGAPDDVASHPLYQRWLYRRSVAESLSVNRGPEVADVRFEDEHLADSEGPHGIKIHCRKCRRLLARGPLLVDHEPPEGKDRGDCAHLFLHPLSWMRDTLGPGGLDGRLVCPNQRCAANIGKFAWQGLRCSCGGWVTPAFALARARVDETAVPVHGPARGPASHDGHDGDGAPGVPLRLPPGMRRGSGNL